jgi:hypothetical protein
MSFTPKPEVEAEVEVEVEVEAEVVVEIEVEVEFEFDVDVEAGVDDVCVDAEVEIEVEIEVEAEAPTSPLPPHSPFLLLPLLSLVGGRRVGDRASMSLSISMSLLFVLPSLPVASVERQMSVMAGASGQCLTLVGLGLGLRSIPMASPAVSTARFATAMVATEFLVAFLAAAILSSML